MRKIKFTEQNIVEKLGNILFEFPRLDDIHPFYADLMNILYDRDHYKLALGQINTAKNLINILSKDYLRLLKYGDSLYRCKQLKRAALGRMCTVLKKLKAALGYLEEVRKHISRLPALDPTTRTLLLTGYPNVGKSSFMNKITRAVVEVQPYAFTTKALFVGHMDHRFLRWQVVDTPGILDRPLEERNTIEMQAITALAHLQCCVLYFLDISEQCGYPLEQQLRLFESIRPLFANKQVMMVANKTDVIPYENLSDLQRKAIEEVAFIAGAELISMSNISEENISELKTRACDKLLEARVESKLSAGRLKDDVLARITVALPKKRDNTVREAFIPTSVLSSRSSDRMEPNYSKQTEKDLMIANGGAGVYVCDYRKYYLLEDDEWKFDAIPEIMDGKNVFDFYDADIEERLRALEEEEAELERQGAYAPEESDEDDLDEEELAIHEAITNKQIIARKNSHLKPTSVPRMYSKKGISSGEIRDKLEGLGYNPEGVSGLIEHTRGRKRTRSLSAGPSEADGMEEGVEENKKKRASSRSESVMRKQNRSTSRSATRGPKAVIAPVNQKHVYKSIRSMERKIFGEARGGEADRRHYPKLVKHLNSGKRSLGTSTIGR